MHPLYGQFLDILEQKTRNASVDLVVLINRLALDQDGLISFGKPFGALNSDEYDHTLSNIWLHLNSKIMAYVPYWKFISSSHYKNFRIAMAQVEKMIQVAIQQRKEIGIKEESTDLLAHMLKAQETGAYNFSPQQLRDHCAIFLNGGTDTVSSTLSSLVYLVLKHPEVEAKILEEINRVIPDDRLPTWEDLTKLEYCSCVVREVMRIAPAANMYGKMNTKPVTLKGGVTIPPGYSIFVAVYPMHHNPNYYKDPSSFIPARWETNNGQKHDPYAFMTFGAGPANCPGIKVAHLECKMFLATVFKRFQFKIVAPEPPLQGSIILRYHYLNVSISKR